MANEKNNNIIRLNSYEKIERFTCKVSVVAADIVIYVPGTTDAFNVKDKILESNKTYWKENIHFQGLFYDFKAQFCEMHINTDFKWTGDNNIYQRKKAGENLFGFLLRYYAGYLNRKVSLHFIGHSHGGLIVNECLKHFKTNKNFPNKHWKVKSITYLSTPFFKKEHLPDTTYFHKDCKIFVVNNKYDLTQRFIADFTLKQLPELVSTFKNNKDIKDTLDRISKIVDKHEGFKQFSDWTIYDKAMRDIYDGTIEMVPEIQKIFGFVVKIFLNLKGLTLNDEIIDLFIRFFTNLNNTLSDSVRDMNIRLSESIISRNDLSVDLNMKSSLRMIADLLAINTTTYESRLLLFLDKMLVNQIEGYNNTVVEPPYAEFKPYYDGKPINVEYKDPYHLVPNKEKEFDQFMEEIERLETIYEGKQTPQVRAEIILRLLAPMNIHPVLRYIAGQLNSLDRIIRHDETEDQIKRVVAALNNNAQVLESFYVDMVHKNDQKIAVEDKMPPLNVDVSQRGSIMYLAFISHSISRMYLDPKLASQIEPLFDSTDNLGYKGNRGDLEKTLYKIISITKTK